MSKQVTNLDSIHALAWGLTGAGVPVWYAARQSGLYASADRRQTWQDALVSLDLTQPITVASVAISPDFAQDGTVFAGTLGGVLRSTDGGGTWSVSEMPSPPPFVVSVQTSPNYVHDGLVFAGTLEDGVFRSWDRGDSWASWNFGLLDLNVYCLAVSPDFASDDTLYVGVESGVFRSTNGGRAWRETPFPMDFAPVLSLALSPYYVEDKIVYAGTETNGVYQSNDGGKAWTPAGLQDIGVGVDHLVVWRRSSSALRILAVTHAAVYVSHESGGPWTELPIAGAGSDTEITAATLDVSQEDAALLVGTSDGTVIHLPLPTDPT